MDKKYTIDDLLEILRVLRGENGCPWDRVQTHETIKKSMIEEVYETIDALNSGDDKAFANELGDVLLQVAFHATIAKERGAFSFDDILYELCTKLITRHTHVFGEDKATNSEEALGTWEKNKKKEKGLKTSADILKDVPKSLPALFRAEKVSKKAAAVGFDWEDAEGVFNKCFEETEELKEAMNLGDKEKIKEEYGDLLFAIVNLGRHLDLTPEIALADATDKFIKRFEKAEEKAKADGKDFALISAEEKDLYWRKIK